MLPKAKLRPHLWPQVAHLVGVLIAVWAVPGMVSADVVGYAVIYEDGSLKVDKHTIRLYGIYIPPTETACRTFQRPVRCASRAALALELKIQGFVRCVKMGRNDDGTLSAVCRSDYTAVSRGEDLAAYLLQQGWAVALPEAPFEYHTLEKIARHRGFGIWGFYEDFLR